MINKLLKIAVIFYAIVQFFAISARAQSAGCGSVNIKIYFPYDQAYIDTQYMGNEQTLIVVDSLLRDRSYVEILRRIEVTAQSSPEGSLAYNKRLSEQRIATLEQYFKSNYPHIDSTLWLFRSVAENWDEFRLHLVEDSNLPDSEEILTIVDSNRHPDDKERMLMKINNGRSWSYIKEHVLPHQRFGASVLFIPLPIDLDFEPTAHKVLFDTPFVVKPLELLEQPIYTTVTPDDQNNPKLLFALKTNMVLDLLSIINIGVEVPIGKRLSVVGEAVYPWWRNWDHDFTMQIESYHGEIKYWLGNRDVKEQLQGWYFGAYGGWGRYDIQPFTRKGVQGTFTDYGLEVGFAHSIARNLHLEYNVGFGYVSTKYEDYSMAYETDEYGDIKVIPYPWMQNSLKYILPTRCGISLVWTIKTRGGSR